MRDFGVFTTTSDGVTLWWERLGAGPPVVLLPGRGDSSDLFPSLFVERLVSSGLSVVRMDPRDTGLSGDGGDEYTLSTMADDVVAVLGAAQIDGAHTVAVSMGGMITVDLVNRFPNRVRSSVFIAAMSAPTAGRHPRWSPWPLRSLRSSPLHCCGCGTRSRTARTATHRRVSSRHPTGSGHGAVPPDRPPNDRIGA